MTAADKTGQPVRLHTTDERNEIRLLIDRQDQLCLWRHGSNVFVAGLHPFAKRPNDELYKMVATAPQLFAKVRERYGDDLADRVEKGFYDHIDLDQILTLVEDVWGRKDGE